LREADGEFQAILRSGEAFRALGIDLQKTSRGLTATGGDWEVENAWN
jgi:hypothetical protein